MEDLRALLPLYLDGLWRRRWSIVLGAWLVCLAGWLAVAMLPNRYSSTAQVYVDTDSILGPLMEKLAVTANIDQQVEVMRKTLLSRPNLEKLLRLADLDLKVVDDAIARENLLEALSRQIRVSALGRNLFQVTYEATSPQEAYRVVDAMLDVFIEQNVGITQRDADSARQFIEKQIAEHEAKLREAELTVATFKREHAEELGGVSRAQQQLENAQDRLRALGGELESAVWRRDQLRNQLASTPRYLSAAEATNGGQSPTEQRVAELKGRLDQLLLVFTEQHPDVMALRGLIAQAEAAVTAERAGGGADRLSSGPSAPRVANPVYFQLQEEFRSAEGNVGDLRRRVELARSEVGRLTTMVAQTPDVEAQLTQLTRDYDFMRERYQALIDRRETAQLGQRLDTETDRVQFRIIDPPVVPAKPSGPPHGLLMAGVLVMGIGSGIGFALLRVLTDSSLRTLVQLKEAFGLPVLGAVSPVRSAFSRRLRFIEVATLGTAALALLLVFGGVFYLYQFRPTKPDLAGMTAELRAGLSQRVQSLL